MKDPDTRTVRSTTQTRVALYDDTGGSSAKRGVPNARGAADLENCLKTRHFAPGARRISEFKTHRVSADDIACGVLQQGGFDVLIQPGGEGVAQAKALGPAGLQAIRDFVASGRSFLGICAGANLASSDENYAPHTLGLVDSRTLDTQPEYPYVKNLRGLGTADIELTPLGCEVFGTDLAAIGSIAFANGPLIMRAAATATPAADPHRGSYEVLATYTSEVVNTPYAHAARGRGRHWEMIGKTAIVASRYGRGRTLCMSPHPEKPQGPNWMIRAAVQWLAFKNRGGGGGGARLPYTPVLKRAADTVAADLKLRPAPRPSLPATDDGESPQPRADEARPVVKRKKRRSKSLSTAVPAPPPACPVDCPDVGEGRPVVTKALRLRDVQGRMPKLKTWAQQDVVPPQQERPSPKARSPKVGTPTAGAARRFAVGAAREAVRAQHGKLILQY
eukprot:Rhum_TRINITY_DN918_c0_g1::Rhum_TRINITY_DN918_c0_g1_i1::g.2730::m.2730